MYILDSNGPDRDIFTRFLKESHRDFGQQADTFFRTGDYLSFFYVLTTWRLLRGDLKSLNRRPKVLAVWKLFLETYDPDNDSDKMMRFIFRKSRQISTAVLHSAMGIGPSTVVDIDSLVRGLFHGEAIIGYSSSIPETDVSLHLKDLAWATFYMDRISWTFCQLKTGTQTGGGAQLDSTRPYLQGLDPTRRLGSPSEGKCWYSTATWRGV